MNFQTLRGNLNPHGCSVRAGVAKNLYYITAKDRRAYSLVFRAQGWACTPINHNDQYSADQLLDIALGKRKHED